MYEGTRKSRRESREPPPEEEPKKSFWQELSEDPNYTGYKYSDRIFLDQDFTESELERDPDWLHACEVVYNMEYGDNAWADKVLRNGWGDGQSKLALDEFGLGYMGRFNYNMVNMGLQAAQIGSDETTQDQKIAFKYMMDAYDHKSIDWFYGTGRMLGGISWDPSTYVGIATLGFATIGAQGVKEAARLVINQGVKESITTSLGRAAVIESFKTGAKATTTPRILKGIGAMGVEGSIYAYKDDENRQEVDIAVGAQKEWDWERSGKAASIGFGAGMALGWALPVAARNAMPLAKSTWKIVDPRNNTSFEKAVTASLPITTTGAVIAVGDYNDEQQKELLAQGAEQMEEALDAKTAEKLREGLGSFRYKRPDNVTNTFNGANQVHEPTTAHKDYGLNPVAVAFNNRMHALAGGLDQPVTRLDIAEEDALKVKASFTT